MAPNKEYEEYQKRVANIMIWLPDFLQKEYDARRMGHLLENHINVSEQRLISRLYKERKYAASSFYGEENVIISAIQQVLIQNAEEIAEYMADEDNYDLWIIEDAMPEHISGGAFLKAANHEWRDGALPCSQIRIAIKKNKGCNEPIICSIYPIV